MNVTTNLFGKLPQGEIVTLFTLENDRNIKVKAINYGATIVSIDAPDRNGNIENICLGFDKLEDYINQTAYMGVTCGRYANRIANGTFKLNGKQYKLPINNGPNSLHGGIEGFNKALWHGVPFQNSEEVGVKFTMISKDGDQGYPGNMLVEVLFSINNLNELTISYMAESDQPTVVNLTNHSYFNLNACKTDVLDHMLIINADEYTEFDSNNIPTGKILKTKNTPFDFSSAKKIGTDYHKCGGYDHNFILNKSLGDELSYAGEASEPNSGRVMEVYTTEPGMQFYTGNFLDGTHVGIGNIPYNKNYGFCLETQHYPDSPNQSGFPTVTLNPGEQYTQLTIYKFGVK